VLDNPVALIVALIGTAGLGGFLREVFAGFSKFRSGISARESNRKRDLVSERDYEYDRAEATDRNRRRLEEVPDRAPGTPGTSHNPESED
jgi:hypothetical protein